MIKALTNFLILMASVQTFAQTDSKNLPNGNYLVVAAFSPAHEDFAIRLSASLNKEGHHTAYGFEAARKFWYVYFDQITALDDCISECKKIQKDERFSDAWVHIVTDAPNSKSPIVATPETVEQKKEPAIIIIKEEPVVTEEKKVEPVVTDVVENPVAAPVYLPQTLKNTPVFLSLFNTTTNEVMDGEVEVVNTETAKLIARVKGNTYITLPNPGTKSGNLSLINDTFGYRKEQLEINFKETERDTLRPYVVLVGNFYMINFGLTKVQKGDISTLYNVYFLNDAAIMLPESKYQLNSLLQMMTENPKMKIVLHGHTNGGGRGKIIYMGPSKNFFAVTSDVINGSGSAKELSKARAETIRQWLISQGISEDRITVKGWGGTRMIHDKNSTFARKNIRVDVEVVED